MKRKPEIVFFSTLTITSLIIFLVNKSEKDNLKASTSNHRPCGNGKNEKRRNKTKLTHEMRQTNKSDIGKIFSVIFFYWFTSISCVFLNKHILQDTKFPFTLHSTAFQVFVSMNLILLRRRSLHFSSQIARRIFPMSLVYVLMLLTSNICLKESQISFYQIARSLTIVFQMALSRFILSEHISFKVASSAMFVCFGFALGTIEEFAFAWKSLLYGVLSSFSIAVYGILIKKNQRIITDHWEILFYNTTIALVIIIPLSLYFEDFYAVLRHTNSNMMFMGTLTGIMGFLINIAVLLQIRHTSPLTNTISGTAKACTQTLISYLYFEDRISLTVFLSKN